ncbi:hypothetical protein C8A03DRAFT_37975 [Achaetomium macrosporum]|uniref:Mannan endo-1,6-alpha-mannosidase n=1 Tax=Achaetomium macrosporum TaxID=79813 RepID=A0AAN7C3E5_9PEZI|nr:hypothetical protein C8A03DRAFT_37975 [Achaetomium macrosporum]
MYRDALPLLLVGAGSASAALQVDFGSSSSIKAAAKELAFDAMTYYRGNQSGEIPGLLSNVPPEGDYYPWTGAVLWSTMIDYWYYTGDDTYNSLAVEGMAWQNGQDLAQPFMPRNWTASQGNDDQGFWGMAAMQAAERNFSSAPPGEPSWIELAQAVFETQAARYAAEETCNGGLRWMMAPIAAGYGYKNSVSNAVFLNLAARLARYTGNQTYAEWASRTWDWLAAVGFIDSDFHVFDGAHVENNCTDINKVQLSYLPGVLLQAAAYMYNQTTDTTSHPTWQSRLEGLANATLTHFSSDDGILIEQACESRGSCTTDMLFFKGILLRSLASAAQLAPFLHDTALAALRGNAEAAVKACAGGQNGRECGFRWTTTDDDDDDDDGEDGEDDNMTGAPAELNALSAVLGTLVDELAGRALVTNATAGTAGSGTGSGSSGGGSGSGGGEGTGSAGSTGNGDGRSAGSVTRAGLGLILAGFVAASML